jgi:hypothetical protein
MAWWLPQRNAGAAGRVAVNQRPDALLKSNAHATVFGAISLKKCCIRWLR